MKKVIIYGLGNGRLEVERAIAPNCEIIAYTDGIAKIDIYNDKPFLTLEKIKDAEFDCVIITIADPISGEKAKRFLTEEYGICPDKVILFSKYKKYLTNVDKVINGKEDLIEGIILGMSTAGYGILSEKLRPKFCNLALPSQDIFYNYETIMHVMRNYEELELKYLIIDMYDYRWFNIDLSLSKSIDDYICSWHGLRYKIHNLERNVNFSPDDINRIKSVSEYRRGNIEFDVLEFSDYYGDVNPNEREKWIEKRKYTEKDVHPRLIDLKVRTETIRENEKLFESLLLKVKKRYPGVRILLLLMPRYIDMNQILDEYHGDWKERFQTVIEHYIKEYDIEFYDFRNYLPICENRYFFYDLEHLNYAGATALSSLMNREIPW